jgi:PAS domain S-box-containing protein
MSVRRKDHAFRALILAPWGRDAKVAAAILQEAGVENAICTDMPCLISDLQEGAALALIVEEALHDQDYGDLARWVEAQPAWSDFPIIILAPRGGGLERNPAAERYVRALGNVTFLERPFHPTTLVSVVQTAMRGRRRQYEARERLDELRSAEERFRTLAENIPTLCWMASPDGHVFWFNSRWYEYTGARPGEHEGWGWASAHDPQTLPAVTERWRHSLETGEPFEMTFPLRGADGVFRPFLTQVVPMRDAQGRIFRWFGTNTNVSREHRDRERLRLMVNELNHRVKNTLATIQAIAAMTLRGEENPQTVRDNLTARILALSKAHDVLTDTQWSGAELSEIAALAAIPFGASSDGGRIKANGPPVRLPPKTAIAVALAFHELATNAAKYGALSGETGRVSLTWTLGYGRGSTSLRIVWRETGGPPVTPPNRTGFGTRLIKRGLAADLNGSVQIDYPPEGVVCVITAEMPDVDVAGEMSTAAKSGWDWVDLYTDGRARDGG